MSRFMSRREMSRVRAASARAARGGGAGTAPGTWPSDPVALGILAGTSLVCLLALTTGLSVLAWDVISVREHETAATRTVTMETDSSDGYVYLYGNTKDLYWTILGGGSFISLPFHIFLRTEGGGVVGLTEIGTGRIQFKVMTTWPLKFKGLWDKN